MDKKPTHRKFKDSDSKITSEDIEKCTDLDTLFHWKTTIDGNIAGAELQIGKAKGELAAEGKYMDPEKYHSLIGYRRVLGFLSQKIQFRQRQLRSEKKGFPEIFMSCAEKMLPREDFERIKDAAWEIKIALQK